MTNVEIEQIEETKLLGVTVAKMERGLSIIKC
jgi:hypothetical protein